MKRLAVLLAAAMALVLVIWPIRVIAKNKITVTGGGQGTFADGDLDPWDLGNPRVDGDLDGDGDVDGSYFGIGIHIEGQSAEAHFVCAM
jgi:hypothetical protein